MDPKPDRCDPPPPRPFVLPQELLSLIIDVLQDDIDTCKACSLVRKSWVYPSQSHLLQTQDLKRLFPGSPVPPSVLEHVRVVITSVATCESTLIAGIDIQCLSAVNSLEIEEWGQMDLSENSIALLPTIFPSFEKLRLWRVPFRSSNHLLSFLASFPSLSALVIDSLPTPPEHQIVDVPAEGGESLSTVHLDVRGRAPRSLHLLRVTIDGPRILSIIAQWLEKERHCSFGSVFFSWWCKSGEESSADTRRFFRMIEGSVEILRLELLFYGELYSDVHPAIPDLSKFPKLETLLFELNCYLYRADSPSPTWIQDILENTPSCSLHTVEFMVKYGLAHAPAALRFLDIDERLSSPRFRCVQKVVVRAFFPTGVTESGNIPRHLANHERKIRDTLPRLEARGILGVSIVFPA